MSLSCQASSYALVSCEELPAATTRFGCDDQLTKQRFHLKTTKAATQEVSVDAAIASVISDIGAGEFISSREGTEGFS